MQELITIVFAVAACVFSFIVGKVTHEKETLKNEIKAIDKGSAAGDAAVRAFRMRKQDRERGSM